MDSITALLADPAAWAALATLVVMEVVLGIDNLIFVSILSNKLPVHQRQRARRLGIGLALGMRLVLLSTIAWLVGLTEPVFDLGLWLGTACVEPDERSRIVVVERDDELIGVLVTLVEDVVTLTQNRIEPPLPGSVAGPIVGIARVGTVPTVLLDAGTLFG